MPLLSGNNKSLKPNELDKSATAEQARQATAAQQAQQQRAFVTITLNKGAIEIVVKHAPQVPHHLKAEDNPVIALRLDRDGDGIARE